MHGQRPKITWWASWCSQTSCFWSGWIFLCSETYAYEYVYRRWLVWTLWLTLTLDYWIAFVTCFVLHVFRFTYHHFCACSVLLHPWNVVHGACKYSPIAGDETVPLGVCAPVPQAPECHHESDLPAVAIEEQSASLGGLSASGILVTRSVLLSLGFLPLDLLRFFRNLMLLFFCQFLGLFSLFIWLSLEFSFAIMIIFFFSPKSNVLSYFFFLASVSRQYSVYREIVGVAGEGCTACEWVFKYFSAYVRRAMLHLLSFVSAVVNDQLRLDENVCFMPLV